MKYLQIFIVPVMLEDNMQYYQEEQKRYAQIEADFYAKLIKQLQKIFSRKAATTTINLYNPLVLDKDSIINLNIFDKSRNQWNSKNILEWISSRGLPNNDAKILAVCDFDAYSNGLNFVFGEAQMGGRVGAIYLSRLRQEFYGFISSSDLFQQRTTKEIVHELGHLLKLSHCDKRYCVMHFSNSLKDTDFKGYNFCDKCAALLFNLYR